jgi:hypothetical protein
MDVHISRAGSWQRGTITVPVRVIRLHLITARQVALK